MWLAKPVDSLTPAERSAWSAALAARDARDEDCPLAQTLRWARATESVGRRCFLAASPDEGVGGVVFSEDGERFECVNGPLLDWDSEHAPRQLATFAMAVSKLGKFRALTLRPRWAPDALEQRLARLPLEPFAVERAATVQVRVLPSPEAQRAALSPRLQRTLEVGEREGVVSSWEETFDLREFAAAMREFGRAHEFTVPPDAWFEKLLAPAPECEPLRFGLARASAGEGSKAELLIAKLWSRSYYLFGYEKRPVALRAALSPMAAAHWRALEHAASARTALYDLNGYVEDPPADHPYAGVSRFKDQFAGLVVPYAVPEFRIE